MNIRIALRSCALPSLLTILLLSCGQSPKGQAGTHASPTSSGEHSQPVETESAADETRVAQPLSFDADICTNECVAAKPFQDDPDEEAFTYCSEQCQNLCAQECSEARDPGHYDSDEIVRALPACVDECMEFF